MHKGKGFYHSFFLQKYHLPSFSKRFTAKGGRRKKRELIVLFCPNFNILHEREILFLFLFSMSQMTFIENTKVSMDVTDATATAVGGGGPGSKPPLLRGSALAVVLSASFSDVVLLFASLAVGMGGGGPGWKPLLLSGSALAVVFSASFSDVVPLFASLAVVVSLSKVSASLLLTSSPPPDSPQTRGTGTYVTRP